MIQKHEIISNSIIVGKLKKDKNKNQQHIMFDLISFEHLVDQILNYSKSSFASKTKARMFFFFFFSFHFPNDEDITVFSQC